jgi:asparagine synthase (glutamine-hydrolysing)
MRDNMTAWMMNYWLRSGNKASFGIPIEPRSPFLDYRVVDFAFSLPPEYLIRDGWHKWILREATKDILPHDIVWRRQKMGFPFPWREWLQQSKSIVALNLNGLDCPYVVNHRLIGAYDELAMKNPVLLWRMICLSLWWKKIIENRSIATG